MILCIETATTNCSVALGHEGKLLALKEDYNDHYSHAERLHLYIEQVLKEGRVKTGDLSAIAVSKGPGSYTGLRIGVSAAKGLCFSLDLPLISVPTLEALALQHEPEEGEVIIPMLDARRMEVYTAGYDAYGQQIFQTRAQILTENSFDEQLSQGKVTFLGNGAKKFEALCTHPNARFLEGKQPSAKEMIGIAQDKYLRQAVEDVAYFEPYYLKDFQPG